MKHETELVIVLIFGLLTGMWLGTNIKRFRIEMPGGAYQSPIKFDRMTGKSWILILDRASWIETTD